MGGDTEEPNQGVRERKKVGILDVSHPYRSPWLVTRITLPTKIITWA
jgi:hypothetical protein